MATYNSTIAEAIEDLEGYGMLEGYAAAEAAKVLADNWGHAMAQGRTLESLLSDVDYTIERLNAFKARLQDSI